MLPLNDRSLTDEGGLYEESYRGVVRVAGRRHGITGKVATPILQRRDGEIRLIIHPIVLGSGKRLFEDEGNRKSLELANSKTFANGVLYLTYRLARREEGESG